MTDHPITPPPELVVEWADTIYQQTGDDDQRDLYVATRAAQWGADQELEACCAFAESQPWGLVNGPHVADVIRAARRPKPPSLKEQALDQLTSVEDRYGLINTDYIRRALEQLDD
jgi:hypothetical protein